MRALRSRRGAPREGTPETPHDRHPGTTERHDRRGARGCRVPVRPDSPTFAELGVRPETVEALAAVGITRAFAIQEYALPIALRGTDLIGQAPTGTGKTLGFGVPLLERVLAPAEGADGLPQALVVVPTRELGLQVARTSPPPARTRGVRVLPIYGGVAYEPQVDALQKRRRDPGRHARPPARPGQAEAAPARPRPRAGARRGRPHARPGLPRRRREDPGDAARGAADHAVLGHHARPDRHAGPALPAPPGDDPRRPHRRDRPVAADQAGRLPHPPDEQDRGGGPHPAGRAGAASP